MHMLQEAAVRRRREDNHANFLFEEQDKQSQLRKPLVKARQKRRCQQNRILAGAAGSTLTAAIVMLFFPLYHGFHHFFHLRSLKLVPLCTSPGRFPLHGTPEFAQACPYAVNISPRLQSKCTVFAHLRPSSNEGIAAWTAAVTTGYFMSLEKHCTFYVDYLPNVDLTQILEAPSGATWRVPPKDFECVESNNCYLIWNSYSDRYDMSPFPNYRYLYTPSVQRVKSAHVPAMQRVYPGFQVNTGMACAWAQFQLAPSASQYVPNLFTQLLPALRDPSSLVFALYIRTGRTEALDKQEHHKANRMSERLIKQQEGDAAIKGAPQKIAACALQLEQDYLGKNPQKQRVVWMIVTDSPNAGRLLVSEYGDKSVEKTNITDNIPRTVLTTKSRGIHTKPNRNPSMADVAEGMIDWFLIGESDLVIQG